MKYIYGILIAISILLAGYVRAETDILSIIDGAKLIAQDGENTFIGEITNQSNPNSICDKYGEYGNKYNDISIWNKYGEYGNKYGEYSATNSRSTSPPMIVKDGRIIGYLTANKSLKSIITPILLKALCSEKL